LDVAKLAGISSTIIDRAKTNLEHLETKKISSTAHTNNDNLFVPTTPQKDPKYEKIKALIESFDINNMTPLQALQLLSKIKGEI